MGLSEAISRNPEAIQLLLDSLKQGRAKQDEEEKLQRLRSLMAPTKTYQQEDIPGTAQPGVHPIENQPAGNATLSGGRAGYVKQFAQPGYEPMAKPQLPPVRQVKETSTPVDTSSPDFINSLAENRIIPTDKWVDAILARGQMASKTQAEMGMKRYESGLETQKDLTVEKAKQQGRQMLAKLREQNPSKYKLYLDAAGGDEDQAVQNMVADEIKINKEKPSPAAVNANKDKKIHAYVNKEGRQMVIYQRPDGTTYERTYNEARVSGGKKANPIIQQLLDEMGGGSKNENNKGETDRRAKAKAHLQEAGYGSDDQSVDTFLERNPDFK